MKPSSSYLSKSERAQLSREHLKNEAAYWKLRPKLLRRFRGKWVVIFGRGVVAQAETPMDALDEANKFGRDAYVDQVGEEDRVKFRIRRVQFPYDSSYAPPLPRAEVGFSDFRGRNEQTLGEVIPDTGADCSALPKSDLQSLGILEQVHIRTRVTGLTGAERVERVYRGMARVNGVQHRAMIGALDLGAERILGREVLNHYVVTFDGKARKVTFEE
jgi:predicted aspartyl protease